jgi:molybdopterin molybdotransferase
MLTLDEARSRLFSKVRRLSCERVSLSDAAGRVLATEVVARAPLPSFAHSAMDGYAVATQDWGAGSSPTLRVVGEAPAGGSALPLEPGAACRIFTGGPLPERSDAVVPQENVDRDADTIRIHARPTPGQYIRRVGEDLAAGDLALAVGTRMTPGGIALAAMLDRAELTVVRRPRVTILATGNELRAVGDGPRAGSIPESNSAALAALARQAGADARVAPIVRDDTGEAAEAIEAALDGADLLVTVGGVSVGEHDVVRPALERAGVALDFWRVAIKPGKPLAVGRTSTAHVLGLPGNPASALVTFALFGVPLIRALQGDARPHPLVLPARLAAPRKRSADRTEFVRATIGRATIGRATIGREPGKPLPSVDAPSGLEACVCDNQASGAATSLATSDGLCAIEPGLGSLEAGVTVDFLRWADL